MKYFFDTEFIEGPQMIRFPFTDMVIGITKPTIDLISIGIVTEDDREFYAISKEFNLWEAWNRFDLNHGSGDQRLLPARKIYWLRENVLKKIWLEMFLMQECDYAFLNNREADKFENELNSGSLDHLFTYKSMRGLLNKYGKNRNEIAIDVKNFIYQTSQINDPECIVNWNDVKHLFPVEFYAYYADYDWVVFCWLFGKMNDLPKGFPMYCKDLKQLLDQKAASIPQEFIGYPESSQFEMRLNKIKSSENYPKETNAHSALADARWNKQLFEFIETL